MVPRIFTADVIPYLTAPTYSGLAASQLHVASRARLGTGVHHQIRALATGSRVIGCQQPGRPHTRAFTRGRFSDR